MVAPSHSHDHLLLRPSPAPLPRGWAVGLKVLSLKSWPDLSGHQPLPKSPARVISLGQRTLLSLMKLGWIWEPCIRNQDQRPRHPCSWFTLGPAVLTQGKAGLVGPQSHGQALPARLTAVPSCPPPEGPVPKTQPGHHSVGSELHFGTHPQGRMSPSGPSETCRWCSTQGGGCWSYLPSGVPTWGSPSSPPQRILGPRPRKDQARMKGTRSLVGSVLWASECRCRARWSILPSPEPLVWS